MACSKSEHTSGGIWPKLQILKSYIFCIYKFMFSNNLETFQPVNIESERTSEGTWPKMLTGFKLNWNLTRN